MTAVLGPIVAGVRRYAAKRARPAMDEARAVKGAQRAVETHAFTPRLG
jgi:hypothetical protein